LSDEKFDRMIELLEEILKWLRLEGVERAKTTLNDLIRTDTEKLVYESSDGRTSRGVADIAGVSHTTVVNYWNRWAKYGIVEEVRSRRGARYKRIFSLSDFGTEVPAIGTEPVATEAREEEKVTENERPSNIGHQVS